MFYTYLFYYINYKYKYGYNKKFYIHTYLNAGRVKLLKRGKKIHDTSININLIPIRIFRYIYLNFKQGYVYGTFLDVSDRGYIIGKFEDVILDGKNHTCLTGYYFFILNYDSLYWNSFSGINIGDEDFPKYSYILDWHYINYFTFHYWLFNMPEDNMILSKYFYSTVRKHRKRYEDFFKFKSSLAVVHGGLLNCFSGYFFSGDSCFGYSYNILFIGEDIFYDWINYGFFFFNSIVVFRYLDKLKVNKIEDSFYDNGSYLKFFFGNFFFKKKRVFSIDSQLFIGYWWL